MTTLHPRPDDQGRVVRIHSPSTPSPASAWGDPTATVVVLPDGLVPASLNGVPFAPWCPLGDASAWWEAEASRMAIPEPLFACPAGLKPAAGALVVEPDGRVWCVAPSNRFGGHAHTLPKGRLDGRSLAAAALVEAFEETGLQVELQAWLCDVARSVTYTRIYVARRVGGSPAACGWESQAVALAPAAALRALLTHPGDQLVLDALEKPKASGAQP
jgi:ADP-ribose pyrophosphatase YjhB (NUDIX family)